MTTSQSNIGEFIRKRRGVSSKINPKIQLKGKGWTKTANVRFLSRIFVQMVRLPLTSLPGHPKLILQLSNQL
jgi:hypothetical protein